ncbi:MAG TPA: murein L,D-transpeptidase family protein [Methyloceanibacter sp.]|jgi:murein L,D-transpeptidase YafK|nr:murein L,D-transpeptidase family protein [Methyloceanibacter sp.]
MRIVALILVVALAGAGYYLLTPEGRQQIDRLRINMARAEYQALFRAGKQLPGTPDLAQLDQRLAAHGVALGVPIYIRIFKLESELELWVQKDGRFVRLASYPICLWSGRLGPKLREGDRQAPEGFYTVSAEQLNPNSRWHRSFNLGFPNAFDQAHGRTGSLIMVHGGCLSIGCYAMTDPVVDEIWRLVTAALENGQERFAVHVFPFRMTERNLRLRRGQQWSSFWADLKKGYDLFEQAKLPPLVSVCKGRYMFEPGGNQPAPLVEERCPPEIAGNS